MVTVALRGGLGNQMFQYALGSDLAKKNGTGLALDTTFLNDRFPRPGFVYRRYELGVFGIEPRLTALSKLSSRVPVPGLWLGLDLGLAKAKDILHVRRIVRENSGRHFDPAVLSVGGDVWLWGFWQSWRYFEDIAPEVRQAFSFRHELSGAAAGLARDILKSNSVALSVRRSDYTSAANIKNFGGTDMAYYDRAIRQMTARAGKGAPPRFFIFSDDIPWCRENIKPPFPTVYIPQDIGWEAAMHLASLARHHIIANSTFWWWAAWLSQSPGKIVIAPRQWSRTQIADRDGIVPPDWMAL
ncbi:MAG TPA: alpha-1,2-fucosyltransferase [Candidatus Paceibacterota bacterium]|nr:alpha-1,2-fucosyltransferase [Candidatus Paceibacterota bacterium]